MCYNNDDDFSFKIIKFCIEKLKNHKILYFSAKNTYEVTIKSVVYITEKLIRDT